MKRQILFLNLAVALIGLPAGAEMPHKAPLKVDFNSLISNVSQEKSDLHEDVSVAFKAPQQPTTHPKAKPDSQRVTDFIDVEIGWGEAPKMVDRRFDSVSEPQVADPSRWSSKQ